MSFSTRRAVAMVAGLSKDQAEVVALRVIAGLDTEAVARMLRKTPGAVRVALHRGLRALSDDPRIQQIEEGGTWLSTPRKPDLDRLVAALTAD